MSTLRRYTNLAAAIHLLSTKSITLLNPATWDDRNDAFLMTEYKRKKEATTVLALCFAQATETYHHWRVFSHGSDGVCIEFDKDALLTTFSRKEGVRHDRVRYLPINQVNRLPQIQIDELPFFKRYPYGDEREYRVVYASSRSDEEFQHYPIRLSWIQRITLSPWMAKSLVGSVKASLKAIDGCSRLRIYRSTLIDNETWRKLAERV